ncbi:MAG: sugar phosphate isomerase/epimerase [Verrucomicrobia bacterium]|nr:sugar phosphate isomerase/epimerase [Verrucomicrobiota bacterium]
MTLTGIGDEGANTIDGQIRATNELGWKFIEMRGVEVPGFPKANLHDIPEPAFGLVERKLNDAGVGIYCFGSTVMNWAKTVETPFEVTLAEVKRAIPRMQRLGTKFIRIMSFKPKEDDDRIPSQVFERVREVTKMFLDAGLQPVHENCMNYGGMSWRHAQELLDKIPGLKWVFDTANPIFNPDRSKAKPWPKQDPWEFWTQVRDHTVHIHVKDATWNPAKNDADYNFPGEGQGRVRDILKDAFARGYDAGISIEPHMVVVFHDAQSKASNEDAMRANYVEYGRRLERLINVVKAEFAKQRQTNKTQAAVSR